MTVSVLLSPRFGARLAGSVLRFAPLPLLLVAALAVGTLFGDVSIPPRDIVGILLYKLGLYHVHAVWSPADQNIIWLLRFPRVLAAGLVGMALGVAGALFQAVLRNPLADPYVIGTAAGAQLGVIVALLLPVQFALFGFGAPQGLAFVGAVLTVLFVYTLARTGGRTPVVTLLLAGFVTSSFLISATSVLLSVTGRESQVINWTMGGLEVTEWSQLEVVGPITVLAAAASLLFAQRLDVLLLGEEQAAHLGVRVEALKLSAIILASFLTALAVSVAGIVAFVGLVVPHGVRLVYGPGHRFLLPASALGGAIFLVVADLIARIVIPPTIIPLGAVTAVIGGPFFLHLLRRSRRDYAG